MVVKLVNRTNVSKQISKEIKEFKKGNKKIKNKKQAIAIAYNKLKKKRRK
tara:strand:- start:693 stop:842 length:150 start_codon:yes stop_codon:yes gene_type:complete